MNYQIVFIEISFQRNVNTILKLENSSCTQYLFFLMKKIIYLLAGLLSIAVISFIGIHFIAPYAILKPPKVNDPILAKQFKQNLEPLNISTVDGIELSAYWITPINPPRGCLILLHGVGGCKEHFLGVANKLRQQDIASIVFLSLIHI